MAADERFLWKKSYVFWIGICLAVVFVFYKIRAVLLPFYISLFVTILFGGMVRRLDKRFHIPRGLTAGVITLLSCIFVLSCLYALFNISFAKATSSVIKIKNNQDFIDSASVFADGILKKFEIENVFNFIAGQFAVLMKNYISLIVSKIFSYGTNIVGVVFLCVLSPIVTFMMLKDAPVIGKKIYSLLPRSIQSDARQLVDEVYKSVFRYLEGQTMTAIVLSCCYSVLLLPIGLEHFIILGIIIGFSSFIPYIGFYLATAITIFSVYDQFHDFKRMLITLITLLVMQVVDSGFITPKIVGNKLGVHPLFVVFGVLVAIPLFGFVGILLALPLVGIAGVVAKFMLEKYRSSSYYNN